jgi:pimeloyl-ACP methyl ester carboxylesterase
MLTRRIVTRDDVDLALFEGGNPAGPTVVMVHGWPDTHRMWLPVAELLAPEFRVVAYDTRGQGESATSAPDASFTLPHLAADLFAVIKAVSPDEPAHVLGHDWGSVQAWEAVCEPGAEAHIASFTSMSGPNLDHLAAWTRRSLQHPTRRRVADLVSQAVSSSYIPFMVSPIAPPVVHALGRGERWRRLLRLSEGQPPRPEALAPTLASDMVSGLRYYRANVRLAGLEPRDRRTTVPVLQLVLTRDLAVREAPLTESDRWTEHLERRRLPHGHWVALTSPEVVAEETRQFVRSMEGSRVAGGAHRG